MQLPEDEVKPGAPDWVVTFGDMMSLLLTFFVLLLSFSSMEAQKFKIIAGYMREAFGLQAKHNYSGIPMGTTILSTEVRHQVTSSDELNLVQKIREKLEQSGMTSRGGVRITERGVALTLEGEILFDSGHAELRTESHAMLDRLVEIARDRSGMLEVGGHTDDIPISNGRFPSNWELAGARAGAAARYLTARGVPASRVRAVGYAETRPLAPNDSPDNRAKNRRVEFLFVRESEIPAPEDATRGTVPDTAPSTADG